MTTPDLTAIRLSILEKENRDLRAEVDLWRNRAKKKEDLLSKYQRSGMRRAD
ncbi:hypothetical protein [Rathayibacter caricis]|uniref:hypothetical protein n=1 Tax=Rathayibacter caricis TaxID=110936 RepID=UPI001475BA69|nr:hypothetical protein [Rathayibacter caricis]